MNKIIEKVLIKGRCFIKSKRSAVEVSYGEINEKKQK